MDSVEFHATNAVQTFETLADSMTSEALTANVTWPFFTSDNFEVKAAHARLNAFAEFVMFMPLVVGKQRADWEAFSVAESPHWLQQSHILHEGQTSQWLQDSDYYRPRNSSSTEEEQTRQRSLQQQQGRRLAKVEPRLTTFNIIKPEQKEEVEDTPAPTTQPTTRATASTTTATTTATLLLDKKLKIPEEIYLKGEDLPGGVDGDVTQISESWRAYYGPVWQVSPPPKLPMLINYNMLADSTSGGTFNALQVSGNKAIVSELLKKSSIDFFYQDLLTAEEHWGFHSSSNAGGGTERSSPGTFPHSTTIAPIRDSFHSDAEIVGFVAGIVPWDLYLSQLLPKGVNGVHAVLSNSCAQVVTYKINGPTAIYLGTGDLHDTKYDNLQQMLSFTAFGLSTEASRRAGQCDYFLELYASDEYREEYDTNRAEFFSIVLAAIFLATGVVFFIFALYVSRRQQKIMDTAMRTNQIVTSLFPANVRDRILRDAEEQLDNQEEAKKNKDPQNLKRYVHQEKEKANQSYVEATEEDAINTNIFGSAPIADLFPEATLMFADLVGFTAWSSMREPTQVFTLLETVYHSFDQIANKRRVFKVETVGGMLRLRSPCDLLRMPPVSHLILCHFLSLLDCYVAVTGVPEPRKDHAVVMCRFAKDCMDKLKPLLKKLEVVLGPDTGDLSMRFGIHSGPVTAGVLRGERARFQLFGDVSRSIFLLGQSKRLLSVVFW